MITFIKNWFWFLFTCPQIVTQEVADRLGLEKHVIGAVKCGFCGSLHLKSHHRIERHVRWSIRQETVLVSSVRCMKCGSDSYYADLNNSYTCTNDFVNFWNNMTSKKKGQHFHAKKPVTPDYEFQRETDAILAIANPTLFSAVMRGRLETSPVPFKATLIDEWLGYDEFNESWDQIYEDKYRKGDQEETQRLRKLEEDRNQRFLMEREREMAQRIKEAEIEAAKTPEEKAKDRRIAVLEWENQRRHNEKIRMIEDDIRRIRNSW